MNGIGVWSSGVFGRIFQSNTSVNVGLAGAVAYWLLDEVARFVPPEHMWGEETELWLAGILTALIGRVIAFLREPAKLER